MDLYEEGFTVSDADVVFSRLVPSLRRILDKQRMPSHSALEDVKYDTSSMEAMLRNVLEVMGYDFNRFRMDISPHPFTIGLGPQRCEDNG